MSKRKVADLPSQSHTSDKKAKSEEEKGEDKGDGWAGEVGVIVHWGPYSVPAFDSVESAKRRKTQNGSEWYLKRLMAKPSDFRPCSGWQATQAHHKAKYKGKSYSAFGDTFSDECKKWQPDEWMALFKKAGATYAILTAKHHDGFCLWPTKTPSPHVTARDVVGEFCAAAKRAGLKVGLYYSWGEFENRATKKYMDETVAPQIRELIKYGPEMFWFDGDWMCLTKYSQTVIDQCCAEIRKAIPGLLINDRQGHKAEREKGGPNYLGGASYRVYADRAVPNSKPLVPWEHVNTIGYSWGHNAQQQTPDYKTPEQIKQLYEKVKALGGRFLINVGPMADGSIHPAESAAIASLK